jgi:nicotinamide mononucleotide transporter
LYQALVSFIPPTVFFFLDLQPMDFFSIENVFFVAWGYPVSYLEFFGLLTGIIAVILSALANVWNWPIGIVYVLLMILLFYQVQLYPDMFLHIFFFITNLIGWWRWTHPRPFEEDKKHELRISLMKKKELIAVVVIGVAGTVVFGLFAENLHEWFSSLFTKPSAAPYLDSFITVMSIIATYYMVQKKIEAWILWLLVDVTGTYLYFVRDIKLTSLLYFIYCLLAAFALWNWWKEYRNYPQAGS